MVFLFGGLVLQANEFISARVYPLVCLSAFIKVVMAIMFADVAGYSKLKESQVWNASNG